MVLHMQVLEALLQAFSLSLMTLFRMPGSLLLSVIPTNEGMFFMLILSQISLNKVHTCTLHMLSSLPWAIVW